MTGCETIQAVLEKVAVEQALSTMPAELRISVSKRNPATSTEAGEMADNYLQVRQQTPKVIGDGEKREKRGGLDMQRCHKCHKEGHLARNCPQREGIRTAMDASMMHRQERTPTTVANRGTYPCTA